MIDVLFFTLLLRLFMQVVDFNSDVLLPLLESKLRAQLLTAALYFDSAVLFLHYSMAE